MSEPQLASTTYDKSHSVIHEESPNAGMAVKKTEHSSSAAAPGVIENCLAGISRDQLVLDVENFATDHGLQEILPILQRAALVAQKPEEFETIADLSEEERQHLRSEKTHKWKHPWALYYTIILNSIAAAVQGWDVTGSNGANLSFPKAFGINDSGLECTAAGTCLRNSWLIGVINAFPFLTISML